jgi:hypothetical protein
MLTRNAKWISSSVCFLGRHGRWRRSMQHPAVRTGLRATLGGVFKKKQKHTLELAQPLLPLATQGDEKLCGVQKERRHGHRLPWWYACSSQRLLPISRASRSKRLLRRSSSLLFHRDSPLEQAEAHHSNRLSDFSNSLAPSRNAHNEGRTNLSTSAL